MADELNLQTKATFAKGGTSVEFPDANAQSINVTVSGSRFIHNRQNIGTVIEAIDLGDIALGGYCMFINRDASNYVSLMDGASGVAITRLKPGELQTIRFESTFSLSAQANIAAVDIEYLIIED